MKIKEAIKLLSELPPEMEVTLAFDPKSKETDKNGNPGQYQLPTQPYVPAWAYGYKPDYSKITCGNYLQ